MSIHVETQGISPDFSHVSGDYDPIDRGEASAAALKKMLQQLSQLPPLPDTPGRDFCPPALFATGADAKWSFTHDGRGLFCEELGDYVDPTAAVKQVTGTAASASRGRRTFPKGRVPQRHPGLEPTNETSLAREEIDQSAPAIVMTVPSESRTWKSLLYVGLGLCALAAVLLAMGASSGEMPGAALGTALVCGAIGVAMIGWAVTHWTEPLSAGVDWGSNTVWMRRGDRFHLASNANCIVSMDATKQVESDGEHDWKYYQIHASYTGGFPQPVGGQFDRKKVADEIAGRLMAAVLQTPLPSRFTAPQTAPAGPLACPQCGVSTPPGARFCESCGQAMY